MKKRLSLLSILVLTLVVLSACSPKQSGEDKIKIGVAVTPHSELVSLVAEDLEAEGIKVEVIEFTDYVRPNHALADGELDANFFQHTPYLDNFTAENNLDLVSIGTVHIEPMALYSDKISSIDDLEDGAEIGIPNDTVNGGRALLLLEANGLIKLEDGAGLEATEHDIVENPKNLKVTALEAAALTSVLQDIDGAVINGNYALDAGLHPQEDGLIVEDGDSPYANLIAVRAGEENEEKFIKLLKALQSDKIKQHIEDNYEGAVVPAF